MFKAFFLLLAALAFAAPLHAQEPADRRSIPPAPRATRAPRGPRMDLHRPARPTIIAFSFVYPPRRSSAFPRSPRLLRREGGARRGVARRRRRASEARRPPTELRGGLAAGCDDCRRSPPPPARSATYAGGAHGGIEYQDDPDRPAARPADRARATCSSRLFEHDSARRAPAGMRAVQDGFCRALTAEVRAAARRPGGRGPMPRRGAPAGHPGLRRDAGGSRRCVRCSIPYVVGRLGGRAL